MTITIRKKNPTDQLLELGGGNNPLIRPNCDVRPGPSVDIVADFNQPLPFPDCQWDGILCQFALEHVSWPRIIPFLQEVFRITKPGGMAVFAVPNTEAQFHWALNNPSGWDGKGPFESASELIFGSQDYPENHHKAYFSPGIATMLFEAVGFKDVVVEPYNERKTDMIIKAVRPELSKIYLMQESSEGRIREEFVQNMENMDKHRYDQLQRSAEPKPYVLRDVPRTELFNWQYFNGGGKFGGYAREGYWDYPVHELTFQHIMRKRPASVLELGCARGYVLKRLQDAGIYAVGMEISKHCYMTRACDNIWTADLCSTPWIEQVKKYPSGGKIDLAFSIATFEHIPEEHLPAILAELRECTERGLHGIDFGEKDDGFDKTHCTLRSKEFWVDLFNKHGLRNHEIVDKEELERGNYPPEYFKGDGKLKLNIGCFTVMYHHGWENIDVHDLAGFAQQNGYHYRQHDVRNGLPHGTASVDLIACSHMLEHLTYDQGVKFLSECRRVLKPGGTIRVAVPDAGLLLQMFQAGELDYFAEINDVCGQDVSSVKKLHALLYDNHLSTYDVSALADAFTAAGLWFEGSTFRRGNLQIQKEGLDMHPSLSLYAEGSYYG